MRKKYSRGKKLIALLLSLAVMMTTCQGNMAYAMETQLESVVEETTVSDDSFEEDVSVTEETENEESVSTDTVSRDTVSEEDAEENPVGDSNITVADVTVYSDKTVKGIFANGTPITIEESGTGTVICVEGSPVSLPDSIPKNEDDSYDLSSVLIFGGWNGGNHPGTTSVTMNGGKVAGLVGGNCGGTLNGDSHITINGGELLGSYRNISKNENFSFAGGCYSRDGYSTAHQDGSAYVTITGGTFDRAVIWQAWETQQAVTIPRFRMHI